MNPDTYQDALKGVDAVVHSMGILLEADYKGVLSGKEPIFGGLKKAFDSSRHTGDNTVRTGHPELSYETMNRDTGMEQLALREVSVRVADICDSCYAGGRGG